MAIKIADLEVFIAIVEAESISRAADNLGVPKSNVSRHLKQLEEELDVRLLQRTTRSIRLTEAGETFYRGAQDILGNLESLRTQVVADDSTLRGRLSVFAPVEFMADLLHQQLGLFHSRYPGLELEFLSGAARPDLLHDRLDLIIHPDVPEDSSYIAVKLCRGRTNFFASPEYLAQHGTPQHPSELYHHCCIAELTQDRQPRPWLYRERGELREARICPSYRCDSLTMVCSLVEQGLGVAMLPVFHCRNALANGTVVTLFEGQHEVAHDVYGIYSSRRLKPRRLEVFLDFLREVLPPEV